MTKILWVRNELDGPINGIAIHNDKKRWFCRTSEDPNKYNIFDLDENTIDFVEQEHKKFCEATGHPFRHGDPFRKTQKNISQQPHHSQETLDALKDFDLELKKIPMSNIKHFEYSYIPSNFDAKIIEVIHKNDFENFYVPHLVE